MSELTVWIVVRMIYPMAICYLEVVEFFAFAWLSRWVAGWWNSFGRPMRDVRDANGRTIAVIDPNL